MTSTTRSRRVRHIIAAAVALVVGLALPLAAQASPITIAATNVWRADRMPNPIGFLPSALVPWVTVNTLPGGDVSQTHVTATVDGNTYNLTRIPTGVLAGIYYAQIPYDVSLDGDWTITATNGANVQTSTRPAFVPVDAMPFVSSIFFTGTGNNITVHWDVTAAALPRLDEQNVSIWDLSNPFAPVTVQFFSIAAAARQLDLSALGLTEGVQYAVEINNIDRNATTHFIDAFSGNWLNGWTPTQGEVQLPPAAPVPEPASLTLLVTGLAGVRAFRRRRAARANGRELTK